MEGKRSLILCLQKKNIDATTPNPTPIRYKKILKLVIYHNKALILLTPCYLLLSPRSEWAENKLNFSTSLDKQDTFSKFQLQPTCKQMLSLEMTKGDPFDRQLLFGRQFVLNTK